MPLSRVLCLDYDEKLFVQSRDHELSVHLRGINYAQLSSPDRPITGRVGDSDKAFEWFAFKAPEIDTSFTHDERVDLWSLGVLLYTLLCGVGPFYGERRDIFSKKSQGVILYEIVEPSEKARSLVRGLIQVDPSRRLRIEEILNHAWMTAPDAELKACSLGISQDTFRDWYQSQR
jgi:Protein kinase domain